MIQWWRLHTRKAGGMDSIPAQGTKVLWHGQKKKNRWNKNIYIWNPLSSPLISRLIYPASHLILDV